VKGEGDRGEDRLRVRAKGGDRIRDRILPSVIVLIPPVT